MTEKENIQEITITRQPLSSNLVKTFSDLDCPSASGLPEDVSTSESIQSTSTSSTHTVIDGSMHYNLDQQSSSGILDGLTSEFSSPGQNLEDSAKSRHSSGELDSKVNKDIINKHLPIEEVHRSCSVTEGKINTPDKLLKESFSDSEDIDNAGDDSETLTTSVTTCSTFSISALPLDVSVESGGSSDTITASVDSLQMAW